MFNFFSKLGPHFNPTFKEIMVAEFICDVKFDAGSRIMVDFAYAQ
jgi:hypothetical protein